MTTLLEGAPAPTSSAPQPPQQKRRTQRRIRIPLMTSAGVMSVLGSALASLAFTWVVFERILPFAGDLAFVLCWYVAFLGVYAGVCFTQWPRKVVYDRLIAFLVASAGVLVLVIVLDQVGYTVYRGFDAIRHANFFTQTMSLAGPLDPLTSGGMIHGLVGSLEQMGIATVLSVPLGVLAALFLVEVGGPFARPVRIIVEAMTALPEIIAGLFIYAFFILSLGFQLSGLAAALALSVMMLPIVTRASEVVLRLVPGGLREASYALGASQTRTIFTVVLPTARSGLSTAVILAMARAVGETSPVLLTAGFTNGLNANPFSGPQVSLPLYIYSYVKFPQQTMVDRAFGAGLALMVMVLILFTVARLIGGGVPGQLSKRQRKRADRAAAAAAAHSSAPSTSHSSSEKGK